MKQKSLIIIFLLLIVSLSCAQSRGSLFYGFDTDFSKSSINLNDILSGGPPKDGIPAIESPQFISIDEADNWLGENEAVLYWPEGNKVYPLSILMWHEIVNDEIIVTYCPLCNTGIGFEREIAGRTLDFGTTGRLRYSNLLMYDRQTETWWQQASGEAVIGELLGEKLKTVPILKLSWQQIKENYSDAIVLSKDTGFRRNYGFNPYTGYDSPGSRPFLYQGPSNKEEDLELIDRVLSIPGKDESAVFTYQQVSEEKVVHHILEGKNIVLLYTEDVSSALDTSRLSTGRDVGAINAFETDLEFEREAKNLYKDRQTGSLWNSFGLAVSGSRKGDQLELITSIDHFWFSAYSLEQEPKLILP